jgi:hypothetical protein
VVTPITRIETKTEDGGLRMEDGENKYLSALIR